MAAEQGLPLTGPVVPLEQFKKTFLETALNEEMTAHLRPEKNQAEPGRGSSNLRNGTRPKTVLTETTGLVDIDVPRDRDGTFEPVIVKKHQCRLSGVDEMVLSLDAHGLTTVEISAHLSQIYGAPRRAPDLSEMNPRPAFPNEQHHGEEQNARSQQEGTQP